MKGLREQTVLVLQMSLAAVLADLIGAMVGVIGREAAMVVAGLDFVVVALCITLLWASGGETGVRTW